MKIYKILYLLTILTGLPSALMGSSACVQEKYHFFTSAQYSYYNSETIFNSSGKQKPAHDDFTKQMGETYLEFGLTDCDTISLTMGWARIVETLNGTTFGFNDMEVGWKRLIGVFYSHFVAIEADLIVPIEGIYEPGLCYGEYGGKLNLLVSKGFCLCDRFAWYDLRLGYLWYSGFPSDQILADASINYNPISKLFIQLGTYLEYGLLNGQHRFDSSLFLYNPNYRLLKGKIEATYCIDKGISIIGGYDRYLWGRNVGTGGRFYCGLQYQL